MILRHAAIPLRLFLLTLVASPALPAADDGWLSLFDGTSLAGWKAAEHPASVRVADGAILCDGPVAHLFYLGSEGKAEFENFELELEIKAGPGANSGVYFHTQWQDAGWLKVGFEAQVNNAQPAFGHGFTYVENKKTGSLYGVRNLYKAMVRDEEWFTMRITVRRPRVEIRLNGLLVTDYTEPQNPVTPSGGPEFRRLGRGQIALQCHDEKSRVEFRKIRIRPLAPGEDARVTKPVFSAQDLQRIALGRENIPLVDLHTQIGEDLTLARIQELSHRHGQGAGILIPAEQAVGLKTEKSLSAIASTPFFAGALVNARTNWAMLPRGALRKFDYVLAEAPAGLTGAEFVQACLDLMENHPVDVLSGVLSSPVLSSLDPAQSARLLDVAVRRGVALAIDTREPVMSLPFLLQARQAGVRFTFASTRATADDWGDWTEALAAVQAAKLTWKEFYVPGHGPTRAQREASRGVEP